MRSLPQTPSGAALASIVVTAALLATGAGQLRRGPGAGVGAGGAGGRSGGVACPERNGRFSLGAQCDAYLECSDGVATEQLCPDGLLFNPAAGAFAHPCQYPAEVDCAGRSSLQPAQPTEDCPHQYGYFRVGRDASDCGNFVNCVDGRGFRFVCPEGLAFDEDALRCDWPDQVASCDAESYLGFRCPEESRYAVEGFRSYRSPGDCQKYFSCVAGRPRLYSCAKGQAFNEDLGGCDGIENVTACARAASTGPLKRRF